MTRHLLMAMARRTGALCMVNFLAVGESWSSSTCSRRTKLAVNGENPVTLNNIALELVPPNVDRGRKQAAEDADKVLRCSAEAGIQGRIRHVMIPGMIEEDDGRPVEMKPKMDVLDFWSIIKPQLPGVNGLCTQVTAF